VSYSYHRSTAASRPIPSPVDDYVSPDDSGVVTGIAEPPTSWGGRHLNDAQLEWFDFDPSGLADFVRRFGLDYPGLPERLMDCRRAAWSCGSYVRFTASLPGSVVETAVIWNAELDSPHQEYGIDLDKGGRPLGVELLHRTCSDT
jgi:hypothetical protein